MSFSLKPPTRKESLWAIVFTGLFLAVTACFIGLRTEHLLMAAIYLLLFFLTTPTRKFAVALLPFVIFGVSYDWMRLWPNYKVNPIDIQGLYEAEKSLFGIEWNGKTLIPGEFFTLNHWKVADFFAGLFYLCWVPVPVMFGLAMYFMKRRQVYLHFAIAFLLVNLIGFVGYYIHPAAPPWYAIHYGFTPDIHTPGNTAGLGRFDQLLGITLFEGIYGRNSNVFAAVPSLHAAYMVVALFYAIKANCRLWVKILFTVIMIGIWCTAVYTTHHYIIDVLLGITCALGGIVFFEYVLCRLPFMARLMKKYTLYIA